MLVITRDIDGDGVWIGNALISIVKLPGCRGRVRLIIDAPHDVPIERAENVPAGHTAYTSPRTAQQQREVGR